MSSSNQSVSSGHREPESNDQAVSQATDSKKFDDATDTLFAVVGERVLQARKARRWSRRELSERSGVSPRYIARIEGGDGNTSIGLLQRIALALNIPIESLVATDDDLNSDIARLVMHYRKADAATRANVLRALDPEKLHESKAGRVCLLGLRGAGKSTLGALAGEHLGVPFVELNHEIERTAGMPVAEVIAMYGSEGYRRLEADTLSGIIAGRTSLVLAVAGGVVEQQSTFSELLGGFHTIWLKADPVEHMERVRAQGDTRPMADNPQAMRQLCEILVARESSYSQAEHHLDTSGSTIDESLSELLQLIVSLNLTQCPD